MPEKSVLFTREPHWLANRQGSRQRLSASVQSWTYEPGSLTQRLRSYYGNAVTVKVLHQQWQTPFLSERNLLNVPEHRFCLVREVMLHANAKPLLLARTIIPEQTIKVAHRNLSHLGTRPLGEVIFSYPQLERLELGLSEIKPSTWKPDVLSLADITQAIAGRRTVYAIAHKPMLVSEFFLPDLLKV